MFKELLAASLVLAVPQDPRGGGFRSLIRFKSSWFHPRRVKRLKRIGGAKSARWLVDSLRRLKAAAEEWALSPPHAAPVGRIRANAKPNAASVRRWRVGDRRELKKWPRNGPDNTTENGLLGIVFRNSLALMVVGDGFEPSKVGDQLIYSQSRLATSLTHRQKRTGNVWGPACVCQAVFSPGMFPGKISNHGTGRRS